MKNKDALEELKQAHLRGLHVEDLSEGCMKTIVKCLEPDNDTDVAITKDMFIKRISKQADIYVGQETSFAGVALDYIESFTTYDGSDAVGEEMLKQAFALVEAALQPQDIDLEAILEEFGNDWECVLYGEGLSVDEDGLKVLEIYTEFLSQRGLIAPLPEIEGLSEAIRHYEWNTVAFNNQEQQQRWSAIYNAAQAYAERMEDE